MSGLRHFYAAAESIRHRRQTRHWPSRVSSEATLRFGSLQLSKAYEMQWRERGALWILTPYPMTLPDQQRLFLALEDAAVQPLDLSGIGMDGSSVEPIAPAQLPTEEEWAARTNRYLVFDALVPRLGHARWKWIRDSLTAVIVFDGREILGIGSPAWYAEHVDDITATLADAQPDTLPDLSLEEFV